MTVKGWEELTPGSNPTVLDEARLQVLAMLRPDWRAVTADDFAAVLRVGDPYIARVVCLPGQAPVDAEHAGLGDVGLIVIPDRAAELTAAARDLDCILATVPTRGGCSPLLRMAGWASGTSTPGKRSNGCQPGLPWPAASAPTAGAC